MILPWGCMMKKVCLVVLGILFILTCFLGCSNQGSAESEEIAFLKYHWGKTPDEILELMELSEESNVELTEQGGAVYLNVSHVVIGDVPCHVLARFIQYGDAQPGLSYCKLSLLQKADGTRLLKEMRENKDYLKLQNYEGFYGMDRISAEDAAWLEKYTTLSIEESGINDAQTRILDGEIVRTSEDGFKSEQKPLVYVNAQDGHPDYYIVEASDMVHHVLLQRKSIEQLYPNGFPTQYD